MIKPTRIASPKECIIRCSSFSDYLRYPFDSVDVCVCVCGFMQFSLSILLLLALAINYVNGENENGDGIELPPSCQMVVCSIA